MAASHQGPNRHAAIRIIVNGQEITSTLFPYLISCQVIDTLGGGHDTCNIELDDRNAELALPPDNVPLQVALGWAGEGPFIPNRGRSSELGGAISEMTEPFVRRFAQGELPWGGPGMELVFSGTVSSVESGFGRRSGGRRVWIEATSGNVMGAAKEGKKQTWGEGQADDSQSGGAGGAGGAGGGAAGGGGGGGGGQVPLSQVLQDAFKGTGITVKIPTEMANIMRPAWAMNQSPADFAQALGKELGGSFKISNGVAAFVKKGSGMNADGEAMEIIEAEWGVNLIGWRIKPYAGRAQWGGAISRNFNIFGGVWEQAKGMIGGSTPFGSATANMFNPMPMATQAIGDQMNTGNDRDSTSRRGTGWILMNGDPRAKAGGFIFLLRARPGVDGKYHMKEVEHNYTRGVGFTTRCNVEYPQPFRSGYTWIRDPGNTSNMQPPAAEQSTDPMAPGYVPRPPVSGPTVFSEEELNRMRQFYLDKGEPIPDSLTQSTDPMALGYVPRPPAPKAQTWTPEELERMRVYQEGEVNKRREEAEAAAKAAAAAAVRPPISGPQQWTPEELERMRAFDAARQPAPPISR